MTTKRYNSTIHVADRQQIVCHESYSQKVPSDVTVVTLTMFCTYRTREPLMDRQLRLCYGALGGNIMGVVLLMSANCSERHSDSIFTSVTLSTAVATCRAQCECNLVTTMTSAC
jgi:hypothetical protein